MGEGVGGDEEAQPVDFEFSGSSPKVDFGQVSAGRDLRTEPKLCHPLPLSPVERDELFLESESPLFFSFLRGKGDGDEVPWSRSLWAEEKGYCLKSAEPKRGKEKRSGKESRPRAPSAEPYGLPLGLIGIWSSLLGDLLGVEICFM